VIQRALYSLLLAAILLANLWLGSARIAGFYYRHRGEKALARAELDLAYESLVASLPWQPGDSPSHVLIGRVIHFAQSNSVPIAALEGRQPLEVFQEGVAAITRGIALNPSDAWAWFNLAEAYRAYRLRRTRLDRLRAMVEGAPGVVAPKGLQNEDPVIIAATLKAKELEPEFSFYHDFLAKLYWDTGFREEAAREIRAGFTLTPQVRAHPWLYDRAFTEALAEPILEGIQRAESNPFVDPLAVLLARAEIFEMLKRPDEAISTYTELRGLGDTLVQAECDLRLAKLHQSEGRFEQSISLLERVLKNDPGSHRGVSALYHLGFAHSKLDAHEEAVSYYRRHLTRKAGSKNVLLALASELEITRENAEAEKIYAALVERFPEDPIPYRRIIDLLRKRRRLVEALRYAERFAEAVPGSEMAASLIRDLRRGDADLP
jgi:tetratricopeptide (TPR) repeat protein